MSIPRYYGHSATLLENGSVLVVGGYGPETSRAEIYDPTMGSWTSTGSLKTPRVQHVAVRMADGRVLVAGGHGGYLNFVNTAEIYDPTTGEWSDAGTFSVARSGATATLLADGTVLVAGGSGVDYRGVNSAETYDPRTGL